MCIHTCLTLLGLVLGPNGPCCGPNATAYNSSNPLTAIPGLLALCTLHTRAPANRALASRVCFPALWTSPLAGQGHSKLTAAS
jgi:hypothetical protein